MTTRISLNEHQLQELLSGQIVKVGDVEIALQDIGRLAMLKAFYESSRSGEMMAWGPIGKPKGEL